MKKSFFEFLHYLFFQKYSMNILFNIKFSAPSNGEEQSREQKNVGRVEIYSF